MDLRGFFLSTQTYYEVPIDLLLFLVKYFHLILTSAGEKV